MNYLNFSNGNKPYINPVPGQFTVIALRPYPAFRSSLVTDSIRLNLFIESIPLEYQISTSRNVSGDCQSVGRTAIVGHDLSWSQFLDAQIRVEG